MSRTKKSYGYRFFSYAYARIWSMPSEMLDAVWKNFRLRNVPAKEFVAWLRKRFYRGEGKYWLYCLLSTSPETALMCLKNGVPADTIPKGNFNYSPLYQAAMHGDLNTVKVLVENGANIEHATYNGRLTPLYIAAEEGRLRVVKYLLSKGANPLPGTNFTPRDTANIFKHKKVASVLKAAEKKLKRAA